MNNDLISRSALKKELAKNITIWTFNVSYDGILAEIIDNAPTISDRTEEVLSLQETIRKLTKARPQGEWIDTGDMAEYWAEEYQCSICGAKDHWHNFCPNCGADMREDK